jgi:hypothetical protein
MKENIAEDMTGTLSSIEIPRFYLVYSICPAEVEFLGYSEERRQMPQVH